MAVSHKSPVCDVLYFTSTAVHIYLYNQPTNSAIMPGPRMGARPPDFDEEAIRQSPTFAKWAKLEKGEKMRYACRDFVKGQENDEERLMRRIMIARRNNVRDHEVLKKARRVVGDDSTAPVAPAEGRKRRPPSTFSDGFVASEMDVPAVEATRSYRAWMALEDGQEFVYNQKYIKGKDGHDWLLRKNIWRRMRYRRENKKMVTQLIENNSSTASDTNNSSNNNNNEQQMASQIVDQALAPLPAADKEEETKKEGVPTKEGYPVRNTRAAGSANADVTAVDKNTTMGTKRPAATTRTSARKAAKVAREVQEPEEPHQSQTYQREPVAAAATTSAAAVAETQVQKDVPETPMEEEPDAEEAHPHHHHTDDDAAVTAAAAATASGAADDLVELSAVEAAVAAAASYVQLTTQQQGTEDHDENVDVNVENDVEEGEHANTRSTVHNSLEAAANAAALESAAKLAAATAAQENKEGEDDQNESTELVHL